MYKQHRTSFIREIIYSLNCRKKKITFFSRKVAKCNQKSVYRLLFAQKKKYLNGSWGCKLS